MVGAGTVLSISKKDKTMAKYWNDDEDETKLGRNPRTGEKHHISASKAAKFTAGKAVKQRVQ